MMQLQAHHCIKWTSSTNARGFKKTERSKNPNAFFENSRRRMVPIQNKDKWAGDARSH
jgi:hypothetical protein